MGKPPYGYNKINPKESVINDATSPFVIRAFQIYSEGNISLSKLVTQLYAEGFTYKLAQPKIQKSQLEHILKNPFYYGMIQFKNELYNGKHEPIITKELFDLAQVAFKKDNKPKYQMPKSFMFANVLKCSNCGCQISGEIKKGKYIYYSCSGGKGECEQQHVYIREPSLAFCSNPLRTSSAKLSTYCLAIPTFIKCINFSLECELSFNTTPSLTKCKSRCIPSSRT